MTHRYPFFRRSAGLALAVVAVSAGLAAAPRLSIEPTTFDFGWTPDNAKVSASFLVTNIANEMVPLTAVQPTCGCTASQFQPGALASNERTRILLTFNTRGYTNMAFNKPTQVKTDMSDQDYQVYLAGHVTHAKAAVAPEGDGIAHFGPDSGGKRQTISLTNKSEEPVTLEVVQEPLGWAKIRLKKPVIAPGESVPVEISISGSVEETRDTSVTFAAKGASKTHRLTLAIRTGTPPRPYRAYRPPNMKAAPNAPASPAPAAPNQP